MKKIINFLLNKPCLIKIPFGFIGVCGCNVHSCRYILFSKTNIIGLRKKTCPSFLAERLKYSRFLYE